MQQHLTIIDNSTYCSLPLGDSTGIALGILLLLFLPASKHKEKERAGDEQLGNEG
jgi:hypothetical protein